MAESPSFLRRGLEAIGFITPREGGSPEDDDAPPVEGRLFSQAPELRLSGAFLKGLQANPDDILRREGGQDLTLFDRLLDDDVAMSCLQQRRLAITSRDWEVTAGDEDDPKSVKAAEEFRAMLDAVGFDRVTSGLHYAIWYGYGVAEAMWTTELFEGRRIVWLDEVVIPDRRWFGYNHVGELRLSTMFGFEGEKLPPNKFLSVRTGGTHDFSFYGLGLAHWAYWPVWFKRAAMRFWALYLEKLANPTVVAGFPDGMSETEKNVLLATLVAIGTDTAAIVPKEVRESVEFMEATRGGFAGSGFKDFTTEQNEALMRIVLGQPGTSKATAQGVGGKQAEVHEDVKAEIVKADADLICEALNTTLAKWVTRWNHGEDVKPPKVYRVLDDEEDLNTVAERDAKLNAMGWQRTEESVEQVYGEGYERKAEPETDPLTGLPADPSKLPPKAKAANDDDEEGREKRASDLKRQQFDAGDPRPLYVSRRLKNTAALKAWARKQGIPNLADDLHVTLVYSKRPVDWFAMGTSWSDKLTVPPGGPRLVERLGDKGEAVVLRFASDELTWRHEEMVRKGASHDYDSFMPHVTLSLDAGDLDVESLEPYIGPLEFGPEIFEEIEVRPSTMFSAEDEEAIERLTTALADEANPAIREFAASIREELAKAQADAPNGLSVEGARVAILQAFERFDPAQLAGLTGLAFVAEHGAAAVGAEGDLTA